MADVHVTIVYLLVSGCEGDGITDFMVIDAVDPF